MSWFCYPPCLGFHLILRCLSLPFCRSVSINPCCLLSCSTLLQPWTLAYTHYNAPTHSRSFKWPVLQCSHSGSLFCLCHVADVEFSLANTKTPAQVTDDCPAFQIRISLHPERSAEYLPFNCPVNGEPWKQRSLKRVLASWPLSRVRAFRPCVWTRPFASEEIRLTPWQGTTKWKDMYMHL